MRPGAAPLVRTGPAAMALTRIPEGLNPAAQERVIAARRGDRAGYRGAAVGVAPVHDDLGAMPAELFGRCLADARGGPGNQGTETLEVSLVVHLSSFRLTELSCPE